MSVAALATLVEELPDHLRRQALTHTSWTETHTDSYERLAYLGDSVLALAVAADISERFPAVDAGGLTKIHNQAVSGVSCSQVGHELGVPKMLEAAEPQLDKAIPAQTLLGGARPVPEVTEALIGACFLAFGFDRVASAVRDAFKGQIEEAFEAPVDAKSALQNLVARRKGRVRYEVIDESGPPHERTFKVAAFVESEQVGEGEGRSKKAAEQIAAGEALERIERKSPGRRRVRSTREP